MATMQSPSRTTAFEFRTLLPGPTRKRLFSPYCYRLTYTNPKPGEAGCALLWEVLGGRLIYQIALERERRLLSCLKKEEREVLIDMLRRLHENLGAVTGQT